MIDLEYILVKINQKINNVFLIIQKDIRRTSLYNKSFRRTGFIFPAFPFIQKRGYSLFYNYEICGGTVLSNDETFSVTQIRNVKQN